MSTRQTADTAGAPEDETPPQASGKDLLPVLADPDPGPASASSAPTLLSRLRALPRPHPRRAWRRWKAAHPTPARVIGIAVTALALAVIVAALVMPNRLE